MVLPREKITHIMSYDDSSSVGSKTPKARDGSSNYFDSLHTLHNISPSAKSPGINIPSPASGSLRQRRWVLFHFFPLPPPPPF